MSPRVTGIHHITAIAGDAQRNLNFYVGTLGLRLVKLTVNFDDPFTYHLYYGDATGAPGTLLTFFPWRGVPPGRPGDGQVTRVAFAVPPSSLPFWEDRLRSFDVAFERLEPRFGEEILSFSDPDGMGLELVAAKDLGAPPPNSADAIPSRAAIRSFHSATLAEDGMERTASLLTDTMGFRAAGEERNRFRFTVGQGGASRIVDVLCAPDSPQARMGAGSVHHIAWRTPDDAQQAQWRAELAGLRYNVSPIMDRTYFHSIYFREPGGVLFEIATDPPGMDADEPAGELGSSLKLPPWLEIQREEIERRLPRLVLPVAR
jgi:glyoxalase family protein